MFCVNFLYFVIWDLYTDKNILKNLKFEVNEWDKYVLLSYKFVIKPNSHVREKLLRIQMSSRFHVKYE